MPEGPKPNPDHVPPREDLSFAALSAELGGSPAAPAEPEPAWTAPAEDDDQQRKQVMQDRLNARVLGASTPKPTPMWGMGIVAGGLALVLAYFASNTGVQAYLQPYFSYAVILLAASALWWNVTAYRQATENTDKYLSAFGVLLGVAAAVWALVVR